MKKFFTFFVFLFLATLNLLQAQNDQSLYAWGLNSKGQLGDGVLLKKEPYQSGAATDWLSIASGDDHNLAIKADGTLWVWGWNKYGQLGDGTTVNNSTPLQIGAETDWAFVAAGDYHSLAIKTDGTLWAWGRNENGRLGDGTTIDRYTPVQIGIDTDWVSITAGGEHNLAIKADGTLWAWGRNNYGQLGDGFIGNSNIPVQIGTAVDWSSVSAGVGHSLATKTDGTLWAWGSNFNGEIGDGTTERKYEPVQIGTSTDWSLVNAGHVHSLAIKTDGTLWAWGANFFGHLGDGTTTKKLVPVQIGTDNDWSLVFAEFGYSIALRTDGTLWAWGDSYPGYEPVQIGTSTDWSLASAGEAHKIAIKADGTLWAWGNNSYGQLGDGILLKNEPHQTGDGLNWALVSAKSGYSLAIKTDGTLWAWGRNTYGQLGDGTSNDSNTPIQIGLDNDWMSVSAGSSHSMAIKTDGSLWGWGVNGNGQLGDGTTEISYDPVQIGSDTDWASVAVGAAHTMALKEDGTLWAWGWNFVGQLGDGTTTDNKIPIQIGNDVDWASVSVGLDHNVAIKTDGTIWAWGGNSHGKLGDGTSTDKHEPLQIGTATDWALVSAGKSFTLGVKLDGTLWAWGDNSSGQLGDGTTSGKYEPVQVGASTDWQSIIPGWHHALGQKADGTLWAWGNNNYGQLGDGTTTNRQSPVQVGSSTDWSTVAAGMDFTIAILVEPNPLPVLHQPQQNTHSSQNIAVEFSLPEAAQAGSVQLTFTQSGGTADANAPHTLTLDASFETAGEHSLTLNGSDLSTSTGVAGAGSAPADALVDGAVYTVAISYQDVEGNPTATDENTGFTYDITAPTVLTKAATLQLNAAGTASFTAADIDAGSTDNVSPNANLAFSFSQSSFSCTEAGVHEVSVTVRDRAGNAAFSTASITVEDATAPSIEVGKEWALEENTAVGTVVGSIEASDNCGISGWSITSGNTSDAFALDAAGSVTVNNTAALDYEVVQEFVLTVKATDAGGNDASESISIKLNEVNDNAPALTVPANLAGDEMSELSFIASATDEDIPEVELAFSLENAPEGASMDAVTGEFSWTPAEEQGPAIYTFSVIVSDGVISDTKEISITVNEVNQGPVLGKISEMSVDEISEISFTATATDEDIPAAELAFSLENAPEGAFINTSTGAFSWIPTEEQGPAVYTFSLSVTDGALSDTKEVTITVNEVNQAPVLAVPSDVQGDEMSGISFTATATDEDIPAQVLEYSLENSPAGASINPSTGEFSWIPTEEQGPHSYTFSVIVSDGAFSDTKEVILTVEEVNEAPVITSEAITSAKEGAAYAYQLAATDADLPENTLTYEALEMPSWLSFDVATQLLSGTPGRDAEESSPIRLQVSDGQESVTQEFTLTVEILTGIFDRTADQPQGIQIYPNPTQGTITLQLDDALAGEQVGISLLDLSGRELLQQKGSLEKSMKEVNAYLQQAKAGIYLLQLERKEKVVQLKVVKE